MYESKYGIQNLEWHKISIITISKISIISVIV